jgi:hypothetical protein
MYEDIKEHMAKVRKNKKEANHQNNPTSNYGRSKVNNYSHSNTEGENSSNSYINSSNGNYKSLISPYTYNNYNQMPNSIEQMQMQLRLMQISNMHINQYESYGTFIRKAVESSDEDEKV